MRIALTGGAGFIGSHTCVQLLSEGHDVLILDTFANAAEDVPERISKIAGRAPEIARVDITMAGPLTEALVAFSPDAVVHFAGLKAVGEAVENPIEYYRVNVGGSVSLLQAMAAAGCKRIVFSSSATVYGDPDQVPIPESHALRPENPYGHSKRMVEQMIEDAGRAIPGFRGVNLRYFNPVGAHPSALLGERPSGVPANLMPFVAQVAKGQRKEVAVFGNDYPTPDGTGVRDYIHVMDLARAHCAALDLTGKPDDGSAVHAINVGTGRGYSVLEMIAAFKRASNRDIPFRHAERRPGDVAVSLADPARAEELLGWSASHDLQQMCADAWAWEMAQGLAGDED